MSKPTNLTRNDNLTGTKNTTNTLEAWKGLKEIIVFLMTHGWEAPIVTGVWSPKALSATSLSSLQMCIRVYRA